MPFERGVLYHKIFGRLQICCMWAHGLTMLSTGVPWDAARFPTSMLSMDAALLPLADFNSDRDCFGRGASGWRCEGDGLDDARFTFVATPSAGPCSPAIAGSGEGGDRRAGPRAGRAHLRDRPAVA